MKTYMTMSQFYNIELVDDILCIYINIEIQFILPGQCPNFIIYLPAGKCSTFWDAQLNITHDFLRSSWGEETG